ncbi:MAG: single-stranded DNA-binding protein [Patescibacteria group bacterium]|nr:single-stranded DNA-binding protein [Patescibacteria group bacterium]
MNLNKVMIIGNLTRDPEVRSTPAGASVTSFSVATNLVWTDANGQKQERVEYHNVVAWRRLADIIGQYLRKGSKVYIEGRLQTRDWVGQDGVKRYRTEIIAENMIMLDRPGNQPNQPTSPAPSADIPVIEQEAAPKKEAETESDEIKLEDIPF